MTVSYLITLYNKEDYIAGVLDAVLAEQAQTGGEIIIYDDCSTDRSLDIVAERMKAHPAQTSAVRIMRGEDNRGVAFATNRLIEAAMQPTIRLIDADDLLVPGSTMQLRALMQKHELGFISGLLGVYGERVGEQSYSEYYTLQDPITSVLRLQLAANPSSSFFAADKLKKVCPVPEWIERTQDFNICLRVACHGVAIGRVNEVVAQHAPYTAASLSAARAALSAEVCRIIALEQSMIPLPKLRDATRRSARRVSTYFRRDGQVRLNMMEKFTLWRWWQFTWRMASAKTCVDRLNNIADLFNRDRNVVKAAW